MRKLCRGLLKPNLCHKYGRDGRALLGRTSNGVRSNYANLLGHTASLLRVQSTLDILSCRPVRPLNGQHFARSTTARQHAQTAYGNTHTHTRLHVPYDRPHALLLRVYDYVSQILNPVRTVASSARIEHHRTSSARCGIDVQHTNL